MSKSACIPDENSQHIGKSITSTSKTMFGCPRSEEKRRNSHEARSELRKKFGENIKVSMQALSNTSDIRCKLEQRAVSTNSNQQKEKFNGLLAVLNELTAQHLGPDCKEYMNSILTLEYTLELYLGYQTNYVSNTATKDTYQQFVEALLHPNTGLFISIVYLPSNGKSYVIQRSPDGSTESALDYILNELRSGQEESNRFELNSESVQSILSTMDSEWDRKIACVLLGVNRLVVTYCQGCEIVTKLIYISST